MEKLEKVDRDSEREGKITINTPEELDYLRMFEDWHPYILCGYILKWIEISFECRRFPREETVTFILHYPLQEWVLP